VPDDSGGADYGAFAALASRDRSQRGMFGSRQSSANGNAHVVPLELCELITCDLPCMDEAEALASWWGELTLV
jgi:hypothetical protein